MKNPETIPDKALFQVDSILQAIPGILYVADSPPHFRTIYISQEIKRLLGYEPEEFTQNENAWNQALYDKDREPALARVEKFLNSEETILFLEYRIWKKNRTDYCWIWERIFLQRDENNHPKAIYGVMTDITEQKLSQEDALESHKTTESIFRAAPMGVGMVMNRVITHANQAFCEMIGYRPGEILGSDSRMIYPSDEEYNYIGEENNRLIAEYGTGTLETRLRKKTGEIVHVTMSSTPLDAEDHSKGVVFTVTDISYLKNIQSELQKEKERAEQSDRLKSAFLANMSHEIRTPMNAIVGFSELLNESDEIPENIREYTQIIVKNTNQLLSIVNDILDISQIESGVVKLSPVLIDVTHLIQEIVSSYRYRTENKGLNLVYIPDKNDERHLMTVDPTKLQQVIENLLNNAVKFTNEGTVSLGFVDEEDSMTFFVEDTGIGIPEDLLDKIFERFHQAESDLNKTFQGTGLGLSISKKLVEFMGGQISAESEVNKGSKFTFTLPK